MDVILLIGGGVVPTVSALGGLFAWGMRRVDRRFAEAALDRRRIETHLGARCDRIEERLGRIEERCDRIEERCDRIEERLDRIEERCDRIEKDVKVRCGQLEERIDRVAGQISGQIVDLNLELGRVQGFTGAVQALGAASS